MSHVTADAACTSITFTTATATSLTINDGITLTVSGAITIPRSGSSFNQIIVGAGILNAGSVAFTSGGGTSRHQITISTGTVTITGDVTQSGSSGSATIAFSDAGLLQLGGAFLTSTTGTLTLATGCTVEYNAAGNQTVGNFTYNNLTLSNSGAKTVTGATINGTLSIQGTATASGSSPSYGASTILEYKGSAAQTTTNVEFPSTMSADVTINNASGVTLNAAKTVSGMLVMTNGTLNMANTNLSVGSLTGSGNLTHSSGTAGARTLTIGTDNTSPAAYTGVISNGTATSVAVTKSGTGTLTLSGNNSYTGLTTISAGSIDLGAAGNGTNGPLGTTAAGTSVTSGAVLDLNGITLSTAEALTLNGTRNFKRRSIDKQFSD